MRPQERPGAPEIGRAAQEPAELPAAGWGQRAAAKLDEKPRCQRCRKVLAWHATRPWRIRCSRCGLDNGFER